MLKITIKSRSAMIVTSSAEKKTLFPLIEKRNMIDKAIGFPVIDVVMH